MRIGIDIGTHAARVAALDAAGRPYLIADRYGSRHMPAVVRYTMHGAEVGDYPARYLICNWENSVRGPGRYLARYADLPAQARADVPFGVLDDGGAVQLDMLYARVAPEAAYGEIIAALRRRAETQLGMPVTEAVITVPASAEDRFRVLVRAAAEAQGLRVHRLVNQPTAALLAFQHLSADCRLQIADCDPERGNLQSSIVAVVDVGGGNTDVSIAELRDGQVSVRATAGDGFLGGHDLAWQVARGLAERLRPQAGRDLLAAGGSQVAALGLLHAAEEALEALVLQPSAPIALDHGAGFGRDLYTVLRREQAEQWLAPDLARIGQLCQRALTAAGMGPESIEQVLLVGGGSGLPGVARTVAQAFGRMPADLRRVEPLALAALGAALVGGPLGAAVQDVTPFPLGINCYYGDTELLSVIVPANTTIPTPPIGAAGAFSEGYATRLPNQTSVRLDVLQYRGPKPPATSGHNRVFPHECELLGSWSFDGLRPKRGQCAAFSVTFALNADGILELLAEETATGHRLSGVVAR
jgi:molecular chaperone DnaK